MELSKFTKIAPVTKSFQLELVPCGNTRNTIHNMKHLEDDEAFRSLLTEATPIIDDVIKDIANRALQAVGKEFDFSALAEDEKAKAVVEKLVDKKIKECLPEGMKTVNDITSAKFVSDILPTCVASDDYKRVIISQLKGKSYLMSEFLTTRITALDTWLKDRIFENFNIYMDNAEKLRVVLASELGDKVRSEFSDIESMIAPAYYGICLTQNDIDSYNLMLAGITNEDGKGNVQGLNGMINEYNQYVRSHKDVKALPKLQKLWKQILMPVEKAFKIESVSSDANVKAIISNINAKTETYLDELSDTFMNVEAKDVIIHGAQLHILSHLVYGDHNKITETILEVSEKNNIFAEKLSNEQSEAISGLINKSVLLMSEINDFMMADVFLKFRKAVIEKIAAVKINCRDVKAVLATDEIIKGSRKNTLVVKSFFNCWSELRAMLKIINKNDVSEVNNDFYDRYDECVDAFKFTYKGENLVRNYITKKDGEGVKFNTAAFGSMLRPISHWWTPGDKFSVQMHTIIQREGHFYYLILPAGSKPVDLVNEHGDCRALQMRKMQTASMALPKFVFTKQILEFFDKNPEQNEYQLTLHMKSPVTITRTTVEAYLTGKYKVSAVKDGIATETEYKRALNLVLSAYKAFLENNEIYAKMDFGLKDVKSYQNAGEFCSQVDRHKVSVEWATVSGTFVDQLVKDGKALLFEITNRNLKNYFKYGNEKLLTGYEKILFNAMSDVNMRDMSLLINSRPKIVYRKPLGYAPKCVHQTGSILVNKYDVNGNHIPADIYEELYRYYNDKMGNISLSIVAKEYINNNLVVTKKCANDIVKDARFYREQFGIKFSYKKNMECADSSAMLNAEVMREYKDSNRIIVIRNTQDLLYYIVEDCHGNILEQNSLNVIDGVDYKSRLKEETQLKVQEKGEWNYTRRTEDLKTGYLSKAISKIARLVIKYNAILIVEKINNNVKDKYSALDDVCFKKFETMLLARFADLYFKDIPEGEPGSFTNPYQLCSNDSKKILQDGIIFLVPNGITQTLDPETGFVYDFITSNVHTKKGKIAFLSKFDNITIEEDGEQQILQVDFDYKGFSTHNIMPKTKWTCRVAHGIYLKDYTTGKYIFHKDPVAELTELLKIYDISPADNIAKVLDSKNITGKDLSRIYQIFTRLLTGVTKIENRDIYISPVTGKVYDISVLSAINLSRKCDFYRADTNKRGEWIEFVATL